MQNEDLVLFESVEHTARRLDYLAISPAFEFDRFGATLGMNSKLLDVSKNPMNQGSCRVWVFKSDIVCDGV